jgi:DNA-binding CsgD family transcriptional regulator
MLNPSNRLTKTEQVIFEIIGKGIISNISIGRKLNISQHTVKNHKENIKQKLKLSTCEELLEFAVQNSSFFSEGKPEE